MSPPVCTIVGGPNGAGKTTFALRYLPAVAARHRFINADLIAAGLSPLDPQTVATTAGRIFLREIAAQIDRRADFAFETTLSGKTHLRTIRAMQRDGWQVHLFYLWLPDVEMAVARVRERVRDGGHDIPESVIRRRFERSLRGLMREYGPICDSVDCFDNSGDPPRLIFARSEDGLDVRNRDIVAALESYR